MSLTIDVVEGDITRESADALITAINSGGMWFGGVDRAIQSVDGNLFHQQAAAASPLRDGETVLARGNGKNHGGYRNVLFVVDDLRRPLDELVLIALRAADQGGMQRITLPAMRTGVMLGAVEPTAQVAVQRLGDGVRAFVASRPRSVTAIRFVVFRDPQTSRLLGQNLRG